MASDKVNRILNAMQGFKTALEGHLTDLERHAQAMRDTHQVEAVHRTAMDQAHRNHLETVRRMVDWFSPPEEES